MALTPRVEGECLFYKRNCKAFNTALNEYAIIYFFIYLFSWQHTGDETDVPSNARLFGLIARKTGSGTENACHIFAEVDPNQPASAIVNFITKVMMVQGRTMKT